MAVKKLATINRYLGLSTDPKPTGIPIGSTLKETDTKDYFVTYDGTNWTKRGRNSEADMASDWRHNL